MTDNSNNESSTSLLLVSQLLPLQYQTEQIVQGMYTAQCQDSRYTYTPRYTHPPSYTHTSRYTNTHPGIHSDTHPGIHNTQYTHPPRYIHTPSIHLHPGRYTTTKVYTHPGIHTHPGINTLTTRNTHTHPGVHRHQVLPPPPPIYTPTQLKSIQKTAYTVVKFKHW